MAEPRTDALGHRVPRRLRGPKPALRSSHSCWPFCLFSLWRLLCWHSFARLKEAGRSGARAGYTAGDVGPVKVHVSSLALPASPRQPRLLPPASPRASPLQPRPSSRALRPGHCLACHTSPHCRDTHNTRRACPRRTRGLTSCCAAPGSGPRQRRFGGESTPRHRTSSPLASSCQYFCCCPIPTASTPQWTCGQYFGTFCDDPFVAPARYEMVAQHGPWRGHSNMDVVVLVCQVTAPPGPPAPPQCDQAKLLFSCTKGALCLKRVFG